MQLVDEHTEYFKSQLDGLAAIERKVFVGVLEIWEPALAKTIASYSRLPVTTCSAYLNRLVERGAVSVLESSPKRKLYQASERLFNIYYLMRKRGHPSARIRAAVRFMINFYRGHQLVTSTLKLAEEACELEPRVRSDHYLAYEEIISHTHDHRLIEEIIRGTPTQFLNAEDLPESVRKIIASVNARAAGGETKEVDDVAVLISMGRVYDEDVKDLKLAERAFRQAVEIAPTNGHAWAHLGDFLDRHKLNYSEARVSLANATKLAPNDSWAWYRYGDILDHFGETDEAIKATRRSLELQPKYHHGWLQLVELLHDSNRFEAAYQAAHEALGFVSGKGAGALWERLAELLQYHLERPDEAETACRNAAKLLKNKSGYFALELGRILLDQQDREEEAKAFFLEAEQFFRRRTEEEPQVADQWHRLAQALERDPGKRKEAEAAHRRSIDLDPNDRLHWDALMDCLVFSGKMREAEETAKESLVRVPGAHSWRRLGWIYERRHKYKFALEAYQKAADLDATLASAWEGISRVVKRTPLAEDLNYLEAVYLKIVKSLGFAATIWPDLLRVQSQLGRDGSAILSSADRFLNEHNRCVPMLDAVAWGIFISERSDLLEYAEEISREALKKDPESWSSAHTLASILALQGNTAEAIDLAKRLFDIVASVDLAIGAVTELAILLARRGEAKAVLTVLMDSKGRAALEPLEVALDEIIGNRRLAPQEISEIAMDIVRRISNHQAATSVTKAAFGHKPRKAGTRRKTAGRS